MMGFMMGSIAVAVMGGLWIFDWLGVGFVSIVEYDIIGIIGVAY